MALCILPPLALARLPLFGWADAAPDHATRRVSTVDGLRGFLALSVVLYHGLIYRHWFVTGRWEPVSPVSSVLGQGGVVLFFAITGYLFWRRLVLSGGAVDWVRLYVGRVFRLGPVYVLAVGIAIVVSIQAGRHVHPGAVLLAKQIANDLLLGIMPMVPVRGIDTGLLLAGVTWSLQYEWLFYLCLPLLALLAFRRAHLPIAAVLFAGSLLLAWAGATLPLGWQVSLLCCFAAGALTGSLHVSGWVPRHGAWSSALALAIGGWLLFAGRGVTSPEALAGFAALFYLLATGCDLFGLLRLRAAHRLGHISYGIYMMQGLALALVLRPLRAVSAGSPTAHLLLLGVASVVLVLASLLAHRFVEQPGIRLGDRVARAIVRRTRPADEGERRTA